MGKTNLIINESFWKLNEDEEFKNQEFLYPEITDIDKDNFTVQEFTRNLGCILKTKDKNSLTKYGVEIRSNGSSRSSRIPLVRISTQNQSIWKVITSLKDVEKGIIELNDLVYFLKKYRPNDSLSLPTKVLVVTSPESEYTNNSEYGKFIIEKVEKGIIILISLEFIKNLLHSGKLIDLDSLLIDKKSILTREPINEI